MRIKKKIVALFACVVSLIACVFGAVSANTSAKAERVTLNYELASEYCLGDTITLPETAQIQLSNGTKLTGERARLVYPNGKATGAGERALDTLGVYTVYYYANDGGKQIEAKHSFKVDIDTLYPLF